jgi:hypothetical protein
VSTSLDFPALLRLIDERSAAFRAAFAAAPDLEAQVPTCPEWTLRDLVQHLGAARPLPDEVALDGVEEFLSTSCAGTYSWPHEPCTVDYQATEGRSWRLSLAAGGVRLTRPAEPGPVADASLRGTASELALALYGRIPVDSLKVDGDRRPFDRLLEWDPDA